ncbi:hypothetical protein [Nonomuraea basaltis]|uniref:hypothetical protein n=1 Tax=Nonomuraea basaltis TaxID=2495887 RepID=UPI00110C4CCA|nr:hypothetical protein [Nonomuraea basaltis]TMR97340.1 hypothetical protein EJK15_18215 [Nonomuraea basaltis]
MRPRHLPLAVGLAAALMVAPASPLLGLAVAFGGLALVAYDFGVSGPIGAFTLCVAAAAAWGLGNVVQRRAFISTLGGFGVWGWLLRRYDASIVAPYTPCLRAPRLRAPRLKARRRRPSPRPAAPPRPG